MSEFSRTTRSSSSSSSYATDSSGSSNATSDLKSIESDHNIREETEQSILRLTANDPTLTKLRVDCASLLSSSSKSRSRLLVEFTKALAKHSSLEKLILSFKCVPKQEVKMVLEALKHNTSVKSLEILDAMIDRDVANVFGRTTLEKAKFQRLCLVNCNFKGSGLAVFAMGLQHCTTLQHIAVESTNLGGYAADVISACLPLLKLKSLRLQNTGLSPEGLEFLGECVAQTPSLISLDLSENQILSQDPHCLSQLTGSCFDRTSPDRFVLKGCGLDRSSLAAMSTAMDLVAPLHLLTLDLSGNNFADGKSCRLLQEILSTHNSITTLIVDECGIHEDRLPPIHDALRYNNSFLKNVFTSKVSLAILDSLDLLGTTSEQVVAKISPPREDRKAHGEEEGYEEQEEQASAVSGNIRHDHTMGSF